MPPFCARELERLAEEAWRATKIASALAEPFTTMTICASLIRSPRVAATLVGLGLFAAPAKAQDPSPPPNFVIIMADDMGYADISPFGGWIDTPALDRLAREGLTFTDFHSNGPVCTPTRAALLTGRYQQRAGLESVLYAAPDHPMQNRSHGLGVDEITFADALRDRGYATGMFGKWHLGYEPRYNPVRNGFDAFRGFVSGNVDFFAHVDGAGFYDWWDGDELINEPGYVTHLITRNAVRFIEQNADRPFVLYLPHEAPHYPFQGPQGKPFRLVGGGSMQRRPDLPADDSLTIRGIYAEMVQEMDRGIGDVVETLERLGLASHTLVFFLSDNGPLAYGSAGPYRGLKGSVWEGGIRVPGIAWWPGTVAPGTTTHALTAGFDLMPTMISLAGASVSFDRELDGRSLIPLLQGAADWPRERMLFWGYEGQYAARHGSWKLVVDAPGQPGAALYDLADDPGETTDLSARYPDRARDMLAALRRWKAEVTDGVHPHAEP